MKRLLFVSGSFLLLFTFPIFKFLNTPANLSGPNDTRSNIISCAPAMSSFLKIGMTPFFTSRAVSGEEIFTNDNRMSAGKIIDGTLYLKLETRMGNWYPETKDANPLEVYAFAEAGKPLQVPGPLIRVPEGTTVNAEIHNTIPGSPLVLRGFYSRPGNAGDSVTIPYGETYKVQFKTGKAGTYMYWASQSNLKESYAGLPFFKDSQLFGAFIVDLRGTKPDPEERIIMISLWNDTLNGKLTYEREELTLNGLRWPYTERLTYEKDKPVNWRIINASNQDHPMHLHGFYYTVKSRGNSDQDNILSENDRYKGITDLVPPHGTETITWTPEREGNWLFHCHTLFHIMAGSFLKQIPAMTEEEMNDVSTHAVKTMGGLIMGIHVLPPGKKETKAPDNKIKERELTLIVEEKKNFYDTLMGIGFILREGKSPAAMNTSNPGPPIILEQGKPVSIKIINRLHESTTIHWHGLEIESYYDGVAGWGNKGNQLAPVVLAGDSFTVHMTPPRAGTFMYHTHMHSFQLFQGMYGPFIVTKPGEKFDPVTNKIFIIGQTFLPPDFNIGVLFLNGKYRPDTMNLKKGINYRFRMINMSGDATDLTFSLLQNGVQVKWRAMAKDGADLPASLQIVKPALKQPVTVGQTYDFEFTTGKAGDYVLVVKNYLDSTVLRNVLRVN